MVDKAQDAYALLPKLKAADLDLVFCDMLTYATSASFGAIVRSLDVPIVLVALQPLPAMDYPRATTHMQLANDDFCSVPEFLGVAIRMGKRPPEVILGTLDNDPQAEAELRSWCDIAMALHDVKRARIGRALRHPTEHMLDMQTDQTSSPPPSAAMSSKQRPTTSSASAATSPRLKFRRNAPTFSRSSTPLTPASTPSHPNSPANISTAPPLPPSRSTASLPTTSSTASPTTTTPNPAAPSANSSPTSSSATRCSPPPASPCAASPT
ncbi:MAG: hypothetical protein IPJ98_05260 [Bryobacterales bacterium]|nr:hypothetical protein [Bryobacterales bacterium]